MVQSRRSLCYTCIQWYRIRRRLAETKAEIAGGRGFSAVPAFVFYLMRCLKAKKRQRILYDLLAEVAARKPCVAVGLYLDSGLLHPGLRYICPCVCQTLHLSSKQTYKIQQCT